MNVSTLFPILLRPLEFLELYPFRHRTKPLTSLIKESLRFLVLEKQLCIQQNQNKYTRASVATSLETKGNREI